MTDLQNKHPDPRESSQMKNKVKSNTCCCVPQCKSKSRYVSGLGMYFFPKNTVLRKEWQVRLRIGKRVTNSMSVCGNHFKKTDFIPQAPGSGSKRKHLKRNFAVPSLNLPVRVHDRKPCDKLVAERAARLENRRKCHSGITTNEKANATCDNKYVAFFIPKVSQDGEETVVKANKKHTGKSTTKDQPQVPAKRVLKTLNYSEASAASHQANPCGILEAINVAPDTGTLETILPDPLIIKSTSFLQIKTLNFSEASAAYNQANSYGILGASNVAPDTENLEAILPDPQIIKSTSLLQIKAEPTGDTTTTTSWRGNQNLRTYGKSKNFRTQQKASVELVFEEECASHIKAEPLDADQLIDQCQNRELSENLSPTQTFISDVNSDTQPRCETPVPGTLLLFRKSTPNGNIVVMGYVVPKLHPAYVNIPEIVAVRELNDCVKDPPETFYVMQNQTHEVFVKNVDKHFFQPYLNTIVNSVDKTNVKTGLRNFKVMPSKARKTVVVRTPKKTIVLSKHKKALLST